MLTRYEIELRAAGFASLGLHAAEAFPVVDRYKPAAIVIGLHASQSAGWSLIQKLKGSPSTRHIPMVVITNQLDPPVALSLLTLMGGAAVIGTPCSASDLLAVLQRVCLREDESSDSSVANG